MCHGHGLAMARPWQRYTNLSKQTRKLVHQNVLPPEPSGVSVTKSRRSYLATPHMLLEHQEVRSTFQKLFQISLGQLVDSASTEGASACALACELMRRAAHALMKPFRGACEQVSCQNSATEKLKAPTSNVYRHMKPKKSELDPRPGYTQCCCLRTKKVYP